jgi:solute carrier family 35 protein F1/2
VSFTETVLTVVMNNQDLKEDSLEVIGQEESARIPPKSTRPPIVYSSLGAFTRSLGARWKSIWTRQFILALVAGQVVSLSITCTTVTTTELINRGWTLSTTQGFFLYFTLFIIYTPYTIYQYGFKGWGNLILRDGWKYFIVALCDVEGNFLVIKAFQYTDLLSCMLLDAWAIPVCMFFCWVYMRTKYHWTQILGVLVCVTGLGLVVVSDQLTEKGWEPLSRAKGDGFMIAGATLYGFTNATEEFLVRKRPLYEVVGQLGMWAFIINGIQSSALEWKDMKTVPWDGGIIGLLMAFTCAMLILYTVAPLLFRLASSAFFNLSLLSSDFYGLLFGLFLYHYRPFWLYFISFVVVMAGLITYFWHATPEEQGVLDPKAPTYVERRRGGLTAPADEEQDVKVDEEQLPATGTTAERGGINLAA